MPKDPPKEQAEAAEKAAENKRLSLLRPSLWRGDSKSSEPSSPRLRNGGQHEAANEAALSTPSSSHRLRKSERDNTRGFDGVQAQPAQSAQPAGVSGSTTVVRLFGDLEVGKPKIMMERMNYDVSKYYHQTGFCQRIARSHMFANATLVVIAVNAVFLGFDTDLNVPGSSLHNHLIFQIGEHMFCGFFALEWLLRFGAFKSKFDCLKDSWFKFDSMLVGLMVSESWIMPHMSSGNPSTRNGTSASMVRLLRLLRLARMTRLFRSIPELWTLIRGMKAATRAVGATLLLLVILIYIFAIMFHNLLKDVESLPTWHTVPKCMWVLLLTGTFMDNITSVADELMAFSPFLVILFIVFVLLSALMIMNMLIGVLCEVVSAVAQAEQNSMAMMRVHQILTRAFHELDADSDGTLSRKEARGIIEKPEVIEVLSEMGVEGPFISIVLEMTYERATTIAAEASEGGYHPKQYLDVDDFIELVLAWRGDQDSTVANMKIANDFIDWKIWQARQETDTRLEALAADSKGMVLELEEVESQLGDLTHHLGELVSLTQQRDRPSGDAAEKANGTWPGSASLSASADCQTRPSGAPAEKASIILPGADVTDAHGDRQTRLPVGPPVDNRLKL